MDIPAVLDKIRPGAAWGMLGEDSGNKENLDWRDKIQKEPTQQELDDGWALVQVDQAADIAAAAAVTKAAAMLKKRDLPNIPSLDTQQQQIDEIAAALDEIRTLTRALGLDV